MIEHLLRKMGRNEVSDVRIEAMWALKNALESSGASIVSKTCVTNSSVQLGADLELAFCDMLTDLHASMNAKHLYATLEGLEAILKVLPEACKRVEETGCLSVIEGLQTHTNDNVYQFAHHLIATYFKEPEEEDVQACLPTVQTDSNMNNFVFGVDSGSTDVQYHF
jgi:hypothetical protein